MPKIDTFTCRCGRQVTGLHLKSMVKAHRDVCPLKKRERPVGLLDLVAVDLVVVLPLLWLWRGGR